MECHDNEIVLNVICSLTHPVVEMNFICIYDFSVSEIHLDTYLAVDTSSSSHYGSRGGMAWTPPASGEGSTPTWTEGTPSFTDSSSSGDFGKFANTQTYSGRNSSKLPKSNSSHSVRPLFKHPTLGDNTCNVPR